MVKINIRLLFFGLIIPLMFNSIVSCGKNQTGKKGLTFSEKSDSVIESETADEYNPVNILLVLPENTAPGEGFRILATGGMDIRNSKIIVSS